VTLQFANQLFHALGDIDTGMTIQDVEFLRCDFGASSISMGRDPRLRSVVRRARIKDCRVRASFVGSAILDEVVVDGLDTGTQVTLHTLAAAFRHVTLLGRIGDIMITGEAPEGVQELFDAANEMFYRHVDWALDISAAEFHGCAPFACVPYHLVRRDPETQAIVRREHVLDLAWKDLQLHSYFKYRLGRYASGLEEGAGEGMVLVASKLAPDFRDELRSIQLLRKAGIAEKD